jgi:hypothetical protein
VTGLEDFETITFADFEFVAKSGNRPEIVCLAWHESSSGTHCLWHDELGSQPPYRTDDKALFVCFVGNAELGSHLALNWPLPANVIDLSVEFRLLTNGRITPSGKGLFGAATYYLVDAISSKHKDDMRARIMQGWPFTAEERARISRYATADVNVMIRLLPRMLPEIEIDRALFRGEFVATLALMEHRGVPIDREIYPQLADQRTWNALRDAMVPAIDAQYHVFERAQDGEWHFSMQMFEAYLDREGITGWPRTETGKLITGRKTFESMSKGHPQLESLRQLRHTRDKMRKIKLAVSPLDFRNRTTLWPFQSKSSRTQPKASQWIFSPAVWLRSLIVPEPGTALAYVDWSSMEFMAAAALSRDPVMIAFYQSGDPYLSFAKRVGAVPQDAVKKTHEPVRDLYKQGLLAIQYGIRTEALAGRLGISHIAAHEMLAQHRELFAVYWRWVDDWVAHALDTGMMCTVLGWQCRTGITEFNERSIGNFPVQACSADALRIACVWATRHGLRLLAPVHDALLLESPSDRIEADVALLRQIMRRASRVVLNSTAGGDLELRTDAKIIGDGERYADRRGAEIWPWVIEHLAMQKRQQETAEQEAEWMTNRGG